MIKYSLQLYLAHRVLETIRIFHNDFWSSVDMSYLLEHCLQIVLQCDSDDWYDSMNGCVIGNCLRLSPGDVIRMLSDAIK